MEPVIQVDRNPWPSEERLQAEADLQALNAGLEERIRARTAELEAEINARRRLEDELRALNANLERRVEERTAEIRAAQAALVESEARYRTIFDNVVDAIYVLDMAGHFLAVNDHACRQYGYRREEFLKLHVSAINTPEEAVQVPARLAAVDRDGYAAFEARHQDAQGHPLTVEVRARKILYNGQPAMLGVLRDITERQRTEALLRQNEEHFRLAFENANTGMCLVDLQGRLLQVNDKMSAIFGYSRQELEGMTVNDLTYPEDLTISPEYISKANQGLVDSATFDKRYRHRDGHLVYGEVASSLVRDHQGQPLYFISQVQDVTARRLAEAHLRASEERFRLVVEHAIDNIWTMGPDQHMRFLSPSIETLVGYGMEEYRELTLEQILMPDSLRVAAAYFAALEARRAAGLGLADFPFRGELELRAKDGTGVWTEIVATPLVDAEGRMTELAGVTRDIRERKRYEDALRHSEQRFRLLLDSFSQIAVQGVTPEGTITFWNQANEPFYGYTAAEALGQDLVELIIPPELRTHVRENIHQMASTGVCPPPEEFSLMRKDGTQVTVYADHAIIDIPGSGRELYSIDIDLTGLRQAEEQLRISEERHRLLADHALDVIWTMGLDGTFHYLSPSVERLRGHTADELMHMPLEAAFTPASWAIVQAGLATARANVQAGRPVDFRAELEELRKDGSIVWTDVRATGIYGSDGRFIELLGVTRDISERKRYEAELQQARGAAEAANQALQAANTELQHLATTDRLTGLWNRHYFEEAVAAEIRRVARYSEQPLSLLLFDIDHFKSINDTHGHLVGDQVLIALTHRVRQHLRATDVLARWGGEEFVVLLPHTGGEEAVRLAEKLRQLVAGEPFPEVGQVTSSFGVAEFRPGETCDLWLKRVDDALYAAKTAGRNRVSMHQSGSVE